MTISHLSFSQCICMGVRARGIPTREAHGSINCANARNQIKIKGYFNTKVCCWARVKPAFHWREFQAGRVFYSISLATHDVMFLINQWDSVDHSIILKFAL